MKLNLDYKLLLFLTFSFFILCIFQNSTHQSDWSKKDLLFMYQLISTDHPGMVNQEDTNFATNAQQAFVQAQSNLEVAKTEEEKVSILQNFAQSFNDSHVRVFFANAKKINQNKELNFPLQFQVKEENNIIWIRIPTFDIQAKQRNEFNKIIELLPAYQNSKKIVFDLRGNTGGNSCFGSKIVAALFGNDYYQYYKEKSIEKITVDWRATPNNINHVNNMYHSFIKQFGPESNETLWIKKVYEGIKEAYDNGHLFFSELEPKATALEPTYNALTAQIIVIVDNACMSACLGFIDDLYAMNYPITLIGQTTKADTLYMDIRQEQLPSGKGVFSFPIKVYRNRPRGHNQPYHPDILLPLGNEDIIKENISNL